MPYRGDYDDGKPDFVILELQSPFTLIEGFVQPACLPTKSLKHGDICFASGWGSTSVVYPTRLGSALRATKLKIKEPLQHCSKGILF